MTNDVGEVASKVRLPAIGLFAVGLLDVGIAILIIASGFFTGWFNLGPHEGVIGVLALAASAVILVGAWGMGRARGRPLAQTASVLAMIPCLSPCFLVGLPVGIWSLVVLSAPDVKSTFR
jgi:hypothetical protein